MLFLDNMNHTEEEDPYLSELKRSAVHYICYFTSETSGWVYYIWHKGTAKSALSLIFRDNYNKILSREEKNRLSRLLEKEIFSIL